jgi:hypothetical protein
MSTHHRSPGNITNLACTFRRKGRTLRGHVMGFDARDDSWRVKDMRGRVLSLRTKRIRTLPEGTFWR